MHTKTINYLICILPLLWGGCDLLESHPYDAHVTGETGINRKNTALIEERLAGKDTVRFAFITDTQRWYDETRLAVRHINARGDIDFVLHGGDQSDFGVTKEFLWMRDILNGLEMPYVCVIGNHDCLGTGKDVFRSVYGDTNFGFTAGGVHFICLNPSLTFSDCFFQLFSALRFFICGAVYYKLFSILTILNGIFLYFSRS